MPKRKYRRRPKQEIATAPTSAPAQSPDADYTLLKMNGDGASSIIAVTDMLQALTALPSDRAKARALRFVQDYFDEEHGH